MVAWSAVGAEVGWLAGLGSVVGSVVWVAGCGWPVIGDG